MAWGLAIALGLTTVPISILLGAPSAAIAQAAERTLTVTGQGLVEVPTTLSQVSLGVEVQAPSASAAQQTVAQRAAAVINLLRSQKVEKLQTTRIDLQPVYDNRNQEQRLVGYQATNIVSFQAPVGQVGNVLDTAIRAGATRIDGISFIATAAELEQAQAEALRRATADARQQAAVVLAALGLTEQGITAIQIGQNVAIPTPVNQRFMASALPAETPVLAGDQVVRASVTLQIRY